MKTLIPPARSSQSLVLSRPKVQLYHWLMLGFFLAVTESLLILFVFLPVCSVSVFAWWTPQLPVIAVLVSVLGTICGVLVLTAQQHISWVQQRRWLVLVPLLIVWLVLMVISESLTLPFDQLSQYEGVAATVSGPAIGLISVLYWVGIVSIWGVRYATRQHLVLVQRLFHGLLVLSALLSVISFRIPVLKSTNWLYLVSFPLFLICDCGCAFLFRRMNLSTLPTLPLVSRGSLYRQRASPVEQKKQGRKALVLFIALFLLIGSLSLAFLSQFTQMRVIKVVPVTGKFMPCNLTLTAIAQHVKANPTFVSICNHKSVNETPGTFGHVDASSREEPDPMSRTLMQQIALIGLIIASPVILFLILWMAIERFRRKLLPAEAASSSKKGRAGKGNLFSRWRKEQEGSTEQASLRRLYRSLLQRAEKSNRAWARRKDETPREYAARLHGLLQDASEEYEQVHQMQTVLDRFTQAYMQERYGEEQLSASEQQVFSRQVPHLLKQLFHRRTSSPVSK